jgi:predicted anti-sigma-YlaC factor YlaD
MEDHREGNAVHLSDEQFAELLMGGSPAQVQAHLQECAKCRAEAERVGGAIWDFSEQSRLWAERRAAERVLRTAAQTPRAERESVLAWLVRPQSWAGAALAIALAVGIGMTIEWEHSRTAQQAATTAQADAAKAQAGLAAARVEATTAQAETKAPAGATTVQARAAVQSEAAVQSATLKADNALLSAIDGELRADESAPASLYGLAADTSGSGTKSAKRISN